MDKKMSMQKSYLMHIIMVFLKLFGTPPVFHLELILKERTGFLN